MGYTHTHTQAESEEEEEFESIVTDPLVFSREEFDTGKDIHFQSLNLFHFPIILFALSFNLTWVLEYSFLLHVHALKKIMH